MHGLFSVKFSWTTPVIIVYTLRFLCYVRVMFKGWLWLLFAEFFLK
jgi:hypothetical protein